VRARLTTGAGAFAVGFRLRERPGWIIGKLGFGV
jgi:hypothetical protein